MQALRKITTGEASNDVPAIKLRVIKSEKKMPPDSNARIQQFWLFCHAALWNKKQFNEEQIEKYHFLISQHFECGDDPDETFKQLIERVCIAKRFYRNRKKIYFDKPIVWLNIANPCGLAKTKLRYQQRSKKFSSLIIGIPELSSSLLHYVNHPFLIHLPYYRNELIRLKQFDLLQIFMNTIFHFQFFDF